MERYIAAWKHNGGTLQHAILDNPKDRAQIRVGRMGYYAHPLCGIKNGQREMSSFMRLVSTDKDNGVHTETSDRQYFGQDFTTEWVNSEAASRYTICKKCVTLIKLIEDYEMAEIFRSRLMLDNVSTRMWPKLFNVMEKYSVTKFDAYSVMSAGVPVKEWEQFFKAGVENELTVDAALLMYQVGFPYRKWSERKGWPIEWVEAQHA